MNFQKFLLVLSIILLKGIVFVRNQLRTNPSQDIHCEDVCTDGRNCLTDEWLLCKWRQLLNPSIVCCLNRKTNSRSQGSPVQSSAVSLQRFCPKNRRHYLVRRDIFSFLRSLAYSSQPVVNTHNNNNNNPWMVEILAFERHLCGGSVIGDYVVLTAAHCFVPFFDSSVYSIRIGFNATSEGRLLSVSKIVRHELYFPSESYHDIALIITKTVIHTNARVDILCLPSSDIKMDQITGQRGIAFGFSHSYDFYNKVVSKQIEAIITPKKECSQIYSKGDKHNIPVGIENCMVCATAIGTQDVELGDSGSPLIFVNNGVQYVVGIVSFGRKSGSVNIPGVYTNVLYYRNWIFNKISKF